MTKRPRDRFAFWRGAVVATFVWLALLVVALVVRTAERVERLERAAAAQAGE